MSDCRLEQKRRRIGCREHPIRRLVTGRSTYTLEGASFISFSLNSAESTALFSRAIL